MKILVDDKELLTLSDTQKQVIKNDISEDMFEDDMKRRLKWVLMHKYDQCFERLKAEWDKKLAANGVDMMPTDKDAYAKLVFAQPNYKDRAARESVVSNNVDMLEE